MKRSGFRRPVLERVVRVLPAPRPADWPRGVMASAAGGAEPVRKDEPVRSEAYRRLVAALPCYRCGAVGRSQAAHGDEGKGMGIKACDLTCWPACGPYGGLPGCHYIFGTSGMFPREYRREFEQQAAGATIAELILMAVADPKVRALLVKVGLL